MNSDSPAVFVTGGSGFIGRHIVRALKNHGYQVRVLARRMPEGLQSSVRVVLGDLTQPESFAPALEGVSTVVHSALTDGLSHDLEATSKLHKLSAEAGVRQFLHLSTISVYGNPAAGAITEETAPIPTPDAYSSTKLAIEQALRAASSAGCPEVAVLRLGCVYGPGGGWWTQGLLDMMARGKLILVDDGKGCANLIHVEDVGAIILLLLARSNPAFEIYNVTDGEPVTWRRYFSEIEKIFGQPATISMTAAQAREYGRKWLRPSLARRVIRKLVARPTIALDDRAIDGFASQAVYTNEKASRVLAFRPVYDFAAGMGNVRAEQDSKTNLKMKASPKEALEPQ
jgi:nucleoside-diphosphate-sugar epimerase